MDVQGLFHRFHLVRHTKASKVTSWMEMVLTKSDELRVQRSHNLVVSVSRLYKQHIGRTKLE